MSVEKQPSSGRKVAQSLPEGPGEECLPTHLLCRPPIRLVSRHLPVSTVGEAHAGQPTRMQGESPCQQDR